MNPLRILWRRHTLERSCRWTRAELERHHARKLAELRRFAVARSPFYGRFHRGLETRPLDELPILTKAAMMEHFDELVTDRSVHLADADAFLHDDPGAHLFRDTYVVLSTSGSSGRRGIFLFDQDEWLLAVAMIARPIAWAGQRVAARPRTAMIASRSPWHYSARISASLSTRLLPSLHLDAAEPLQSLVRQLNEWQPDVLAVYPSVLKQLADEQMAGRLRIRLQRIATSAEVLPDEARRRAREAWGAPVFDTYGATEYAPIAAECAFGRKHLLEDRAIIEIVDEHGRAVPPGVQGDRLLLTIFDRRTQPLIRYEISDMVRAIDGQCECGRPFRLIQSIEGRIEDILYFQRRDGGQTPVAIHPLLFHSVLEPLPVSGWQVEQIDDGLHVSLVGVRDSSVIEPIATTLRQAIEAQAAAIGDIRVRVVDGLRRGASGKAPLILAKAGRRDSGAVL